MTILKFLKLAIWAVSYLLIGGVLLPYLFSQPSTIAVIIGVITIIAFFAIFLLEAGVKFK